MPFVSDKQRRYIFAKAGEGEEWAKKFIKHSKKKKKRKIMSQTEQFLNDVKLFASYLEEDVAGKPPVTTPEPKPVEEPKQEETPTNPVDEILQKTDELDKLIKELLNNNAASKKLQKINVDFENIIALIAKLQIDKNKENNEPVQQ
jgi:transcription termination factor NusB